MTLQLISLAILILCVSQISLAQIEDPRPIGNWSISYHPYQGEHLPRLPVIVYGVVSQNLKVAKIRVTNVTTKPIKSIKVRWLVYENQNRGNLLTQGQTPPITFIRFIPPGESRTITYPVVSVANFYRNFLVDGRLDKEFNVDLLVDEVGYLDGSGWNIRNRKSKDTVAKFSKKYLFLTVQNNYAKALLPKR